MTNDTGTGPSAQQAFDNWEPSTALDTGTGPSAYAQFDLAEQETAR